MPENRLCIWMNIPSHHQTAFFYALAARDDVDLVVCYFQRNSTERSAEGWDVQDGCDAFERFVEPGATPEEQLSHVPDANDRIHIICSYFSAALIDCFCTRGIRWCHWSEMPGYRLAELLGYQPSLFRLSCPIMLRAKRKEGRRIARYALGALGQGQLARMAFRRMAIPDDRIADLYYAPAGLAAVEPCREIATFSRGRRVFLSVAALCRRKGIDLLLKAFARCRSSDWVLVLCGLDKSDGRYVRLAQRLGVSEHVLFLGAYPVGRIAEVFAASDVLVLATRFDGWGAVLNEGASLGLPMISTDLCGAAWHLIRPGETGYRVRAGAAKPLEKAMRTYICHPEKIEEHGRAARAWFDKEFTPERNAERLVETLTVWGCSSRG
jgi:glycosyltransferase involved in cell wall biosynthesis